MTTFNRTFGIFCNTCNSGTACHVSLDHRGHELELELELAGRMEIAL